MSKIAKITIIEEMWTKMANWSQKSQFFSHSLTFITMMLGLKEQIPRIRSIGDCTILDCATLVQTLKTLCIFNKTSLPSHKEMQPAFLYRPRNQYTFVHFTIK